MINLANVGKIMTKSWHDLAKISKSCLVLEKSEDIKNFPRNLPSKFFAAGFPAFRFQFASNLGNLGKILLTNFTRGARSCQDCQDYQDRGKINKMPDLENAASSTYCCN